MSGLAYGSNSVVMGFHAHFFFALLMFFGLVMLGVWAAKNLKKAQLKKFALCFLLAGVLGMFLTAGFIHSRWQDDDETMGDVVDEMMGEEAVQ